MFPKSSRHGGRPENMDEYLQSMGLWRKNLPKDGASLYRAVAEQVFGTQALHEHVRKVCVKYINTHRADLVTRGAGPTEMKALSLIYRKDFVIFQHAGRPAINLTGNGFPSQICLCVSNGNHYDEVFRQSYIESAAISQSILYEILYERVFGLEDPVDIALDMIAFKPGMAPAQKTSSASRPTSSSCTESSGSPTVAGQSRSSSASPPASPDNSDNMSRKVTAAPFPYRVAKLLSPYILRNVEHDVWVESTKGENIDDLPPCNLPLVFAPGDKCQVMLDGHSDHMFNAHIQELHSDSDIVTVFVEELGVKKQVTLNKLIALPKVINIDNSWKRKGKKKIFESTRLTNEAANGARFRVSGHAGHLGGRVRINSAGHPIHQYADSAQYQQRKSVNGYPSRKELKSGNQKAWMPRRRQRYNSEPGDSQAFADRCPSVPLYWEAAEYNTSGLCESTNGDTQDVFYSSDGSMHGGGSRRPSHNDAPIDTNNNNGACNNMALQLKTQCQFGGGPESSMRVDMAAPQSTVVHHVVSPPANSVVSAMPYYNVMIPLMDNFSGPINMAASLSVDPMGSDLPMHDCSTMRFFFNLGLQYYRISSCIQQQQPSPLPQPLSPFITTFPMNGSGPGSMCMAATPSAPVCSPDIFFADDGVPYGPCTPGMSPPPVGFFPVGPGPQMPNGGQFVQYMSAPVMSYAQGQ